MAARPRAFISYARADGEAFATALRKRLQAEQPELTLWQDRNELEGGIGWWKQIADALEQVEILIMVMTPAVIESVIARKEWRYARQQGVRICPVIGSDPRQFEFSRLPSWMRKVHCYDLEREWDTFVGYLVTAPRQSRVPFMAPDQRGDFIDRPSEYQALLSLLMDRARVNPVAMTTALQGAGGFGKTTLAAAACHDDDVIAAYDDGILWVTLGERPAIQQELTKLYAALTGERPAFVDADDASIELAARLEDKNCLIVLDDVWDANDVRPFLRGGRQCSRLITTRRLQVITGTGASQVLVDEMTEDESVAMLVSRLSSTPASMAPFRQLAKRLGEWPLLLRLAASQLRERIERGDSLDGALAFVNRALDRRGAVAFDRASATVRDAAVSTTVGSSLALLGPEDRVRAIELSIFAEARNIPLSAAAALWDLDDFDTEELVQRLDDASLVEFDLKTGQLRMHDVLRSHLRAQLADETSVHRRLVTSRWSDPYALPDDFAWRWIGWHLVQAGRIDRLHELLLDFGWLTAKLRRSDVQTLIRDFGFAGSAQPYVTVTDALRLAAYNVDRDPDQLLVQMRGRLERGQSPALDRLLDSAVSAGMTPRIVFGYPSLTHPGGALTRIIKGHADPVETIEIAPDGRFALSGAADWKLKLWDIETWRMVRSFEGHAGTVHAAAFAYGGRHLVSGSQDRTLRVWDVETGRCRSVLRGHHEPVRGVAVALTREMAASVAEDGTVRLWDLAQGQSKRLFKGDFHQLRGIAFTPDDRHVIFGAGDGTLRMLSVDSGQETAVFEGHTAMVNAVAIAPDGCTALSASDDGTLRLWDVATRRSRMTLRGHQGSIGCVAFDARLVRAVSGGADKTLRLWNLQSGEQSDMFEGHAGTVRAVALLEGGMQAVSGSADRTLCCWRLDGSAATTAFQRQTGAVSMLGISQDGRAALSGSSRGALAMWKLGAAAGFRALDGHSHAVQAVRMTADGKHALTASRDHTLCLWNLEDGRAVHILLGHWDGVSDAVITPSGNRAASISADRTIRVWDLERGIPLRVLIGSETLRRLDYLRQRGLVSDTDATLVVDNTTLPVNRGARLAISSDGTRVVFADGSTIAVWHTDTGHVMAVTLDDFDTVELAIDADAHLAVVGSMLGTLCVVDLDAGQVVHTLDPRRGMARTSRLLDIVIDESGRQAVTASRDGTFHFWNLSSGTETASFDGGVASADAVAIAPDTRFAYSVAGDTLMPIDLRSQAQLQRVSLDHNITALAVSAEGTHLAVGDESGRVHFLSLEAAGA